MTESSKKSWSRVSTAQASQTTMMQNICSKKSTLASLASMSEMIDPSLVGNF